MHWKSIDFSRRRLACKTLEESLKSVLFPFNLHKLPSCFDAKDKTSAFNESSFFRSCFMISNRHLLLIIFNHWLNATTEKRYIRRRKKKRKGQNLGRIPSGHNIDQNNNSVKHFISINRWTDYPNGDKNRIEILDF